MAADENLRQLLFLVPYVSKHPGQSLDQVAAACGFSKSQLLESLEKLTLVGHPPFSPGDFLDVYVEEDRVYADLDQRLTAPPRWTVEETQAFLAAAMWVAGSTGTDLTAVVSALEKNLSEEERAGLRQRVASLGPVSVVPQEVHRLHEAANRGRVVRLEYPSAGGNGFENRTVEPWEVVERRGHWYLLAWCRTRNEERLFRVDRMGQLTFTEEAVTHPMPPARASLFETTASGGGVRIAFDPSVSALVAEEYPKAAQWHGKRVEMALPAEAFESWIPWILSFGGAAEVLAPEGARRAIAEEAKKRAQAAKELVEAAD